MQIHADFLWINAHFYLSFSVCFVHFCISFSKYCFFSIFSVSRQPSFSPGIEQNSMNSSSKTLGLISAGKPNISAAGKGVQRTDISTPSHTTPRN